MDSFLEREKELMKLNETLNQKCAITLAARSKVSKVKKTTSAPPTKKTLKNVKSKPDSKSATAKINSFALADANKPLNDKKVAADSSGNGNGNEVKQAESVAPKVEPDTANEPDNRDPIEKFLDDFTVESKIKLTDDSPAKRETVDANRVNENSKPTNGVSLIPNNMVRRNVSADGIIK